MMKTALLAFAAFACAESLRFEFLKVTWGVPFFNKAAFRQNPLRVSDMSADWAQLPLPDACDGTGLVRGRRFIEGGDPAVVLIYDKSGFIVGMQSMVAPGEDNPFDFEGNRFYTQEEVNGVPHQAATVYFVDPESVCTERTEDQFTNAMGDQLYLLQKVSATSTAEPGTLALPNGETELDATTLYDKHPCFYSMGVHHWYNISADMECEGFNPVFILTNDQEVTGFGFAHIGMYDGPRFEHPAAAVISGFFDPVPTCYADIVNEAGGISTVHVFLYASYMC